LQLWQLSSIAYLAKNQDSQNKSATAYLACAYHVPLAILKVRALAPATPHSLYHNATFLVPTSLLASHLPRLPALVNNNSNGIRISVKCQPRSLSLLQTFPSSWNEMATQSLVAPRSRLGMTTHTRTLDNEPTDPTGSISCRYAESWTLPTWALHPCIPATK
jgi:hypothetical protein